MSNKSQKNEIDEVELRKDGWERFEKAVDAAVKSGPKHRVTPKPAQIRQKGERAKARQKNREDD